MAIVSPAPAAGRGAWAGGAGLGTPGRAAAALGGEGAPEASLCGAAAGEWEGAGAVGGATCSSFADLEKSFLREPNIVRRKYCQREGSGVEHFTAQIREIAHFVPIPARQGEFVLTDHWRFICQPVFPRS